MVFNVKFYHVARNQGFYFLKSNCLGPSVSLEVYGSMSVQLLFWVVGGANLVSNGEVTYLPFPKVICVWQSAILPPSDVEPA